MKSSNTPYLTRGQLEEQSMVALDALEADDPRSSELLRPIYEHVRMHGEREGRQEYERRVHAVATGEAQEAAAAWPRKGAWKEYVNDLGVYGIVMDIGIPERLWEHVLVPWRLAFMHGYGAAHVLHKASRKSAAPRKSAAQLDREIAEVLGGRRAPRR